MEDTALIRLRGLCRAFDGPAGRVTVLDGIDLDIPRGSFTVIRGASGAGKTTLLRVLGLLDSGFSGSFTVAGADVATLSDPARDEWRGAHVGFVFQEGRLLPHLTLAENIALPLVLDNRPAAEVARRGDDAAAFAFRPEERAAGTLGLMPDAASGGQRQRAALARAMVRRPLLILADEPTASLDPVSKAQVIERLRAAHAQGATVVVVSHDDALFGFGRQLCLQGGRLEPAGPDPADRAAEGAAPVAPVQASLPRAPLGGWWPRLGPLRLAGWALRDLLRRPLFATLMLIAVIAGTAQSTVFASLVVGLDRFVEQTVADGSRLTRLTLKPRKADAGSEDRFPDSAALAADPQVAHVIARRATTVSVQLADGGSRPFPSLGLFPDDPELSMFRFVAGAGFDASSAQLQAIVTTDFLVDLLGQEGLVWDDHIGRRFSVEVPRFGRNGKQTGAETLVLTVAGIILKGEGDRQFYLANDLLVAIDAIKRDRGGKLALPLTADRSAIADPALLAALTDWPWQDMLHLYLRDIDAVIPRIAELSAKGYRPEAEIWKYAWVLDMKRAAYGIGIPLLALISGVVGMVIFGNIVISARMRAGELALVRVLGMRRGDIFATEVLGALTVAAAGLAGGLGLARWLTVTLAQEMQENARLAAKLSGDAAAARAALVFEPVGAIALPVSSAVVALVLVAILWPTFRAASTDPARVFARR
ncbi:MAG: hypothetical protein RIR62_1128 [Pseudomonadota bacterium]